MPLKAADLDQATRQVLLKRVEHQVGTTQYRTLIGSIGEDGVLNAFLDGLQSSTGVPARRETRGFWKKYGAWAFGIVLLFSWTPYWTGFQFIAIALSVVTVVRWFRDRGIGIGKLIVGLLGLGFVYVMGLAVLGSTNTWWSHVLALPVGFLWLWLMAR